MEAELFHADKERQTDRQVDMTKLLVAYRNFANAPIKAMQNSKKGDKTTSKSECNVEENANSMVRRRIKGEQIVWLATAVNRKV